MRKTQFAAAALILSATATNWANAQSFMGLGDLPGGDFASFADGLSADGSYVTGTGNTANGSQAFLWSEQTGIVGLGIPTGSDFSDGAAVSNDGSKVVGFHANFNVGGSARAFVWSSGSGAVDFNPFPVGAEDMFARDLSADGAVIVGDYRAGNQTPNIVFHWDGSTLTDVVGSGFAGGVSADGTVMVGTEFLNPNGPPPFQFEAFRWTQVGGVVGLGYLDGGSQGSLANGISADGDVVVGSSDSADGPNGEAFRWTESGGMVGLGDLPGGDFQSSANDTTADGSIVVGASNVGVVDEFISDFDPFIWDVTHGMRNLIDVLVNDYGLGDALAGWNLSEARAISDDGLVIVGIGTNPDGNFEAWRAVLVPEPSSVLIGAISSLGLLLRRTR